MGSQDKAEKQDGQLLTEQRQQTAGVHLSRVQASRNEFRRALNVLNTPDVQNPYLQMQGQPDNANTQQPTSRPQKGGATGSKNEK